MVRKPGWLKEAEARLRPMDRWSKGVALAAGGVVGVGAGALAGATGEVWAAVVGAGALGVAGWLASSGEAIAVVEEEKRWAKLSDALGMIELPGGKFWMGSAEDDPRAFPSEKPRHQQIIEPFVIGRFVVRESLYRAVIGSESSEPQEDDLPVINVSWFDALRFCNALSAREGRRPAYQIGDGERPNVAWDKAADGFRLPTEAEREYAARAETATAYSFGDDALLLNDHAWWSNNSEDRRHPVGTKKPNPWGLFDVHGNVDEWCWDVFANYEGIRPSVGDRVIRGGSFWNSNPRFLRAACRYGFSPVYRDDLLGFRCARNAVTMSEELAAFSRVRDMSNMLMTFVI